MTTVAVTGASGFVGSHLLSALRDEDYDVRGLARPGSSTPDINQGDIRRADVARPLVEGADMVIHMAASFAPGEVDVIMEGTRTVLAAAREAGIKRLIYVSCLGAEAAARSAFFRAKWEAETLVRSSEVPHIVLRPSLIMGRGDGFTRPLASLIKAWPVTPVPGSGMVRTQPIDVRDVVRALQVALTSDSLVGQTVDVAGPIFMTFRQLADLVSGHLGVSKPKLLVPYSRLPVIARLAPKASRALFEEPRTEQFRSGVVTSPGTVERLFGFEPRSVVSVLGEYLE